VSRIAVCWNFDTTLLTTRNTVLGSSIEIRSSIWSCTRVDRVERAVGLTLLYSARLPEKPRVDTRLASNPGIGDSSRRLKDKRKSMHDEEVIPN
jgi:hypothetical protein